MKMRYFDYTTIADFLRCHYYYYYRHVRHLVPILKPTYFGFGSAWHAGLEVIHKGGTLKEAQDKFNEAYKDTPEDAMRTVARGQKMLELYTQKYKFDPYQVLYAETPFHIALDNFILCGRCDAITKHKVDGHIYLKEVKTSSRTGASYFEKFTFNYQIDIYTIGCLELMGDCAGALIDVAKLTSTAPKVDDFERDLAGRSYLALELAKKHIVNIVKSIISVEGFFKLQDGGGVSVYAPDWSYGYFNKEKCYDYGRCVYSDICKTNLDERALKKYKEVDWNAEEGKEVQISGD